MRSADITTGGLYTVTVLRSMARQLKSRAVTAPAVKAQALRKTSRLADQARQALEAIDATPFCPLDPAPADWDGSRPLR